MYRRLKNINDLDFVLREEIRDFFDPELDNEDVSYIRELLVDLGTYADYQLALVCVEFIEKLYPCTNYDLAIVCDCASDMDSNWVDEDDYDYAYDYIIDHHRFCCMALAEELADEAIYIR